MSTKTYIRAALLTAGLLTAGFLAPTAGASRPMVAKGLARTASTELVASEAHPLTILMGEVVIRGGHESATTKAEPAKAWRCKSPDALEQSYGEIDALSHGGQGATMTVRQCGWVTL